MPPQLRPVVDRLVVIDVQSLLIEAGFDNVEIAQCFDEAGKPTGGYDYRLEVDSVGHVAGFLERMELYARSPSTYRFEFILADKGYTFTREEISQRLLKSEPISTALQIIRRRDFALIAIKANKNLKAGLQAVAGGV